MQRDRKARESNLAGVVEKYTLNETWGRRKGLLTFLKIGIDKNRAIK